MSLDGEGDGVCAPRRASVPSKASTAEIPAACACAISERQVDPPIVTSRRPRVNPLARTANHSRSSATGIIQYLPCLVAGIRRDRHNSWTYAAFMPRSSPTWMGVRWRRSSSGSAWICSAGTAERGDDPRRSPSALEITRAGARANADPSRRLLARVWRPTPSTLRWNPRMPSRRTGEPGSAGRNPHATRVRRDEPPPARMRVVRA